MSPLRRWRVLGEIESDESKYDTKVKIYQNVKYDLKHCQRHNGPEVWIHLAKVTSCGHITSSNTNLDHMPSSESQLLNLKASTKNLNQTLASPLNLKLKILTKPSFRISTKIQLHNLYKTSAAKYWTNSSFKISPKLQFQNLDQSA